MLRTFRLVPLLLLLASVAQAATFVVGPDRELVLLVDRVEVDSDGPEPRRTKTFGDSSRRRRTPYGEVAPVGDRLWMSGRPENR
jgi:hypothetical protein